MRTGLLTLVLLVAEFGSMHSQSFAQTPRPRGPRRSIVAGDPMGWSDSAELSFVSVQGNAGAQTFGFRNRLSFRSDSTSFRLDVAGIRSTNTKTERAAVRGADEFVLLERDTTRLTAERFLGEARFSRELAGDLSWVAAAGWNRNRFAGIRGRSFVGGGLAYTWRETERTFWETDFGLTYTLENRVLKPAGFDGRFPGVRASSVFGTRLSPSVRFENELILDENLEDTEDLRIGTVNGLTVNLASRLALRVSAELLYDNQKAFLVFLVEPQSGGSVRRVVAEAQGLDTLLTVALVLRF